MEMASEKTLLRIVELARNGAAKQKASSLAALAHDVIRLQTADKFLLASMLLNAGLPNQAEAVGMRACQEIQLSALFMKQATT